MTPMSLYGDVTLVRNVPNKKSKRKTRTARRSVLGHGDERSCIRTLRAAVVYSVKSHHENNVDKHREDVWSTPTRKLTLNDDNGSRMTDIALIHRND